MLAQEILNVSRSQLLLFDDAMRRVTPNANTRGRTAAMRRLLGKLAARFSETSSIHGANRVFNPQTGRLERVLWSIALALALAMLVYVCLLVGAVYQRKQLETVIDSTKYPVYKLPFPEVTVCNRNRLNWSRLAEAGQLYLNATHQRAGEFIDAFEQIVARFDTLAFGHFHHFEHLPPPHIVTALSYVNFTAVVQFMAWRCDELLRDCVWQREAFNCCDAFFPRNSQLGRCWAFNSIESAEGQAKALTDRYWPWRVGDYGPGSALVVRVLLRVRHQSPHSSNKKGALFMLNRPGVWYDTATELLEYTRAGVSINTFVNFYENDTRSMPPSERGCVFDDEHETHKYQTLLGRKYGFQNCQSKCQKTAMLRYCNCTMDLFFPQTGERDCNLTDYACLARHNLELQQAHRTAQTEGSDSVHTDDSNTCECLNNCFIVKYMPDVRSATLHGVERAEHEAFVRLDLYFRRSMTLSYKTALVFTWVDLLVSFGGLAGLCLGCSLISLFELAHFVLVDAVALVMRELHGYRQQQLQQQQQQQQRQQQRRAHKRRTSKHTMQWNKF